MNPETKKPLSLKNDYVFRSVLGKEGCEEELADFLKSALGLPEDDYDEITVLDPEQHAERRDGKQSILDIRIRTKTGKYVSVDIQRMPQKSFRERIAYYNARMFTGSISAGEAYEKLGRAVTVVITDFPLFDEDERYLHRFFMHDRENGIRFTDAMEIVSLELPKLPEGSDGTALWDWLELIKTEDEEEMEMLAEKNPHIRKTVGRIMTMSADEAERMIAEARDKERRDRIAERQYAWDEGLAAGEARGEAAKQRDIARKMKARGRDIDEIAEDTGLDRADIEAL